MINRRFLVAPVIALALGAAACDSDKLTRINDDPNNPTDVPATSLFTNGVRTAVGRWLGSGYNLRGTEFVAQHLAEVQYPDDDRYNRLTGPSTETYFNNPYVGELKDLQIAIEKGTDAGAPGIYAPALAMRTWVYSYLTDTWGDIPYSEALQATETGGIIAPKYDAQQEIYADFFAVLDKVSTDLENPSNTDGLGPADPIYGGSFVKWQKFANSLRLRLAMRISNADPALASQQIAAALAAPGGLITSNIDNAILSWPGGGVYNNPWADNFKTRDDHRVSAVLIDQLVATDDPRLPIYAMPTELQDPSKATAACPNGGQPYAGLVNAWVSPGACFRITSRPGALFYPGQTAYGTFGGTGSTWPSFVITAAEVNFLLAEAAERGLGGVPGTAKSYYDAGIRASMAQWGVTDPAVVTAFLAQPGVAYAGGVTGLEQIATQKWVALYTDGGNAWAEWRRTCEPQTIAAGNRARVSYVPRRFQYSPTEYTVNEASLDVALSRQGDDSFGTRVWWDQGSESNPNSPTWAGGCPGAPSTSAP